MPVAGGVALDVELPAPDARTRCQAVFADSTVAYTYDPGNRLTRISDTLGGTITRTYDSLDRLTGETTPQGAVSYGYDAAGRRTHLSVSGQPTASYAYDAAGRLTQLTQGTATVQFRYDAAHRRTGLSLPSGITATYTYDDASQLTGLTYQKDGTVLGDLPTTPTTPSATARQSPAPWPAPACRRPSPTPPTTPPTGAPGLERHGACLRRRRQPAHRRHLHLYTWDARNRLTHRSRRPAVNASFQYDAFGRRIRKTVAAATAPTTYTMASTRGAGTEWHPPNGQPAHRAQRGRVLPAHRRRRGGSGTS